MKLAVISHTPHYYRDGVLTGWGPTVRELDHLTGLFGQIIHLAPLHDERAPESSLAYESPDVRFIPLKKYGGESLLKKFSILTTAKYNLKKISEALNEVDWVQFRAPTAMGLYVMPYLSFRKNPKRWVKYAGNWKMADPPFSYSVQKWMLEKNFLNCKVTINGWWEGQKPHILSFPNPCLDDMELLSANEFGKRKDFTGKLHICFVGTLTENKGSSLLIEALRNIEQKDQIRDVTFAGGGALHEVNKKSAESIGIPSFFPGFLGRNELEEIYSKSHIIILPSMSEGFPKVIAEAAAYGCVPVVSNVSSISQFFGSESAYLIDSITAEGVRRGIEKALSERQSLKQKSQNCMNLAHDFTYGRYMYLLKEKVLECSGQQL